MPRMALVVALVCAAAACKERNPEYCDRGGDCPSGTCILVSDGGLTHVCQPGAPVGDSRLADAGVACGLPDARSCDNPFPVCGNGFCRGCTSGGECPAAAPVCASGSCDRCTMSSQCAGRDAGTICDVASGGCVQCLKDSDCPATLCDLDHHVCLPPANVLFVDATKTGTDCTQAAPCPTLAAALAKTTAAARSYLRVSPGNYAESLAVGDRDVVIAGTAGTMLLPRVSGETPLLASGTARVWLRKLGITGGNPAARCTGTSLRLSDVTIASAEGVGVDASMCDLTVERTLVRGSAQTGINLGTGATFHIHDSVIIDGNGAGVALSATGAGTFDSNTVTRNAGGGVSCVSTSTLTFRDDIVWANTGNQIFGCLWNYSDIGPGTAPTGTMNLAVDPLFKATDDYHLAPTSPVQNKGDPLEPPGGTDIDGDARPQGGRYDIGADEAG